EREIALVLGEPPGGIVAADAERAVKLHAVLLAAALVGRPHGFGIDRIFGLVVPRIAAVDIGGGLALEVGERRAGERIDLPRLQIAAGGGAGGPRDEIAHDVRLDRFVEKGAASDAGVDGFEHVHGMITRAARERRSYTIAAERRMPRIAAPAILRM